MPTEYTFALKHRVHTVRDNRTLCGHEVRGLTWISIDALKGRKLRERFGCDRCLAASFGPCQMAMELQP